MAEFEKNIGKESEKEYIEKPLSRESVEKSKGEFEKIELTEDQRKEKIELKKEVEKTRLAPEMKVQAKKESEQIKKQSVQGKIQHLLDLTQSNGVVYAVEVARKMNNPYLLDLFHDALAREGFFKKFSEK